MDSLPEGGGHTSAAARAGAAPQQRSGGELAVLGALAEALPALVFLVDPGGRIVHANSRLAAHTGRNAELLAGRSWLELVHSQDQALAQAAWAAAAAQGRPLELACTLVEAQGAARRFHCRAVPTQEAGAVTGWAFAATESPQGVLVQQVTGHGEAGNSATFNHAAAGIAHVARDGRFLAVNDRFCAIAGHDRAELLGSRFQHITHPEDLTADEANVAALVQGRIDHYTMEKRYLRADGSTVWVRLMVGLVRREDGAPDHFVSVIDDISAHKAAEEELRRHRDTVHALVRNSPFGIVLVDGDFRLREASLGARQALAGIDPLIGRDCAEVLRIVWHEPFASQAIERLRYTLHTGKPYAAPRTVQPRRDCGEVQAFEWHAQQVVLPDGRAGVVCYFYDLSERVAWEAALRESERRFQVLAECVPVVVWTAEASGSVTYFNRRWYEYSAQVPQQALGAGWMNAVHPDDVPAVRTAVARALSAGAPLEFECRYRRHDGAWRWHLERGEPLRSSGAITAWFGTAVDVHEQRQHAERAAQLLRLEQRLREAATAREAATVACEVLGMALQSDFAGIGELMDDGEHLIVHSQWRADGSPAAPLRRRLTDTALEHVLALQAGDVVCVDEVRRDGLPATDAAGEVWPDVPGVRALLQVPLVRQGTLRAVLFVGCSQPCRWDEGALALARDTLERAWHAIARARAEEALRSREAHLAALYAQTGAGLYELDLDGCFVEANQRFCQLVGLAREALLGQRMLDITQPDDRDANRQLLERLVASGEPFSTEKRYVRPDGGVTWVTSTMRLIRSPSAPPRVFAVSIDVTARRRLQEQLQELQELQRLGAEAGHMGVWSLDLVTLECALSPMMARLLGYGVEQGRVTAEQWRSSIVAEDRTAHEAAIAAALEGPGVFEREFRIRLPDGSVRWLYSRGEVVRDAAGQPQRLHGATVDVTRRRQAEDELRQTQTHLRARHALLAAVLASTDNLVFVKDREGRYLLMNEAGARLHGRPAAEFIGRTDAELQDPGFAAVVRHNDLRVLQTGQTLRVEESGDLAGQWRTYFSTKTPLRDEDGHIMGVVGMAVDITEHKAVAAGLAKLNATLEQRVQERTAELAAARDAAEAASRAKGAFLANMSHEIRTPMNAILGLAHLLAQDDLAPRHAQQLAKIESAGQHLLSIINDILDLSRIEAGKLQLEARDFELPALLEQVRSIVGASAAAKGLAFEVDTGDVPARLRGDDTRVRQALLNYAGNAVKFTATGSITLRARLQDRHDARLLVRFEVEDTGVGVKPAQVARLFDAFEQADASTTREHGGTGLGLAITRRLAELMGGGAGAQARSGSGSVFWFTAWMEQGSGAPVPEAVPTRVDAALRQRHAGARVLVAEDHLVNREVALALLRAVGLDVDFAEDGAIAVEKVGQGGYVLVLMDMQMPVMDGLQAARALRSMPGLQNLPILAMTANAFGEDRAACLAAGMDDFVSKPVEPQTFYATLLKWLDHGRGSTAR